MRAPPDLRPYAPRRALEWLASDPATTHRRDGASLVFVDISGFTAMSERLARLGRIGAEEVTDLLNLTFSRLLAVAYDDGGSLLKFGGDALLVEFVGPNHPARAVTAAHAMRRELRRLQPLDSSAGKVRLRMSVGVHSGEVDLFLVGSDHRELLVAGPAVTEVVRMEGAAGPGQIMVSAATVEALDGYARFEPSGPGFLLRRPPRRSPDRPIPTPGPHTVATAGMLLSDQLRRRVADGRPSSEHRPAVIGFVKFGGVDGLLASHGPEAAARALGRLVDTVVAAAAEDEVCLLASDVDADGGKLILTAGVPTSHQFDGERMLRALRRAVEADLPLPVRIGVNHGPVFAGVIGPPFRLTYTIIGDAVNVAARVMANAEPGSVLATAEVLNRSQVLFDVEPVPPFSVKGKRVPLTAYRVGPVRSTRMRRPRAEFRLAGRQRELQALVDEASLAAEGPGRVVQLIGPAGIGKSRLVDEFHERCPAIEVVLASASRYEATTPFHVVRQLVEGHLPIDDDRDASALRRAVMAVAPELEPSLPLLADVVGIDVPDTAATSDLAPANRAERVADAVGALLERILPDPAVVVVEDLYWSDPDSLAVLRSLCRSVLRRRRWLMLLTTRQRLDLDERTPGLALELGPLGPDSARELVLAAAEAGMVTIEHGQALLERAGGNPFFLQELLRTGAADELPESVDALIQSQLDELGPGDREILGHAAVLGAEIDLDLLAAVSGQPVDGHRRALSRLDDFVEPTARSTFRFRHDLVHRGAYERLPFRERRALHRRAADILEARDDRHRRVDLLAVHTHHARDWERAHRYALEAAADAAGRFANLTASAHYRRALEAGRYLRHVSAVETATTWERLGDALLLACSYEDAVEAYRRALRLSPPTRQVRLCGQIGQLRERQARYTQALRWYARGIKLDRELDTGSTGRMLVESGIVRIRQGKPSDAIVLATRAEDAGGDLQTAARISYLRAWAAMLLGDDAAAHCERTLELFEEAGDLVGLGLAYNAISMAAYYRGDWDEAADAYRQASALRRRIGDQVAAAAADGNLGELLSDQGRFDPAKALLDTCRDVCAAAGYESSRRFAEMTLGRLAARRGDFDRAEELLAGAHVALVEMKMSALAFDARRYQGELALFRGDHRTALAVATELDVTADEGAATVRLAGRRLRACAELRRGDLPAALEAAQELRARLAPDATDHDTALSLTAVAAVFQAVDDAAGPAVRSRAQSVLGRLGVVVPGELLVFGPEPGVAAAGTGRAVLSGR